MQATHPAGTSTHRSGNPILDSLIKKPKADESRATTPSTPSESRRNAEFTKIHSESSSSDYPDASHASKTKEKHLRSQDALLQIGKLEVRISTLRKELKAAEREGKEKAAEKISKELKNLTSEKKKLIAASGLQDRSANSRTIRPANPGVETPANPPARGGKAASSNSPGRTITSTTAAVGHTSVAVPQDERMVQLNDMLETRRADMEALTKQLAALQQTHTASNAISAAQTKLHKLQTEIDTLNGVITIFSSSFSDDKDEVAPLHNPPSSQGSGATDSAPPPDAGDHPADDDAAAGRKSRPQAAEALGKPGTKQHLVPARCGSSSEHHGQATG